MRFGSLFSGAGGLDMAVEAVFGGETLWHCEIDPAASKVLAARWPGVPNLGDITAVDWSTVEPVDVLCGGFPCQDVSAAGRRAGMGGGTRSGLWAIFADAIAALRPPIVVIENVRGLLSAEANRAMESAGATVGDGPGRPVLRAAGAVLGDLADVGYDAQWATVSAASVGACHRRERVFILATNTTSDGRPPVDGRPGGSTTRRGRERWPSGSAGFATTADSARNGRDERWAESSRVVGGSDVAVGGRASVDLLPTPTSRDHKGTNQRSDDSCLTGALLPTPAASRSGRNQSPNPGAAIRPSLDSITDLLPTPGAADGSGGRSPAQSGGSRPSGAKRGVPLTDIPHLLPTPEAKNSHAGPDYARMQRDGSGGHDLVTAIAYDELAESRWGKYEPAIRRWETLTRRAPSPTELNTKGNPRLHPPFSEWMIGYPAGWITDVEGISRNDQLRIIGNSVVPQQAAAAILRLLNVCTVAA